MVLEKSTETNIKLSVIVPVYNVETTLNSCLESIFSQHVADMEVILIDDGSTDGSAEICNQWSEREERLTVIHQINGGLSQARNTGISRAHGQYITFVDSDDVIIGNTYAGLLDILAEHPEYDMLEYGVSLHHGSCRQRRMSFGDVTYTDMKEYWIQTEAYRHAYAWNKIYRKKLFDNVRFPVGKLFEDIYTLPLLLEKASCVVTTSQGLYGYCDNPRGLTALAGGAAHEQLLDAQLQMFARLTDYEDTKAMSRYYLFLLNRQITVCRLTGKRPVLPYYRARLLQEFGYVELIKIGVLRLVGVGGVCRLFRMMKR
uniref:Glycosyltransferase 2-like domain-containing protein n=1 Tax=Prevotella sp. GTC17254 TaxID=3236794 RepID=A0AB33J3Y2_9BACT